MNGHFDASVGDRSLESGSPARDDADSAEGWIRLKYAAYAVFGVTAVILGVLGAQTAAEMVSAAAEQVLVMFPIHMGLVR